MEIWIVLYDKYITLECSLMPFSVSLKWSAFLQFLSLLISHDFHVGYVAACSKYVECTQMVSLGQVKTLNEKYI